MAIVRQAEQVRAPCTVVFPWKAEHVCLHEAAAVHDFEDMPVVIHGSDVVAIGPELNGGDGRGCRVKGGEV